MRFSKDTFRSIATGVKTRSRRGFEAAAGTIGGVKDKIASNLRGVRNRLSKLT